MFQNGTYNIWRYKGFPFEQSSAKQHHNKLGAKIVITKCVTFIDQPLHISDNNLKKSD